MEDLERLRYRDWGKSMAELERNYTHQHRLGRLAKDLPAVPFVERANTHVVLTTVKEDFRLPL